MERTTIREAHGGRRHSALLEATPAVMPRACLLVIGRAFLVLDARVGQWRENTLVLTVPSPPSYLSATYIHCLALYCCSSWETATGNDETESCQCFLSAFLSESPFSFFVTWKKGTGWDERREDADKSSLQCSRDAQVLTLLARVRIERKPRGAFRNPRKRTPLNASRRHAF